MHGLLLFHPIRLVVLDLAWVLSLVVYQLLFCIGAFCRRIAWRFHVIWSKLQQGVFVTQACWQLLGWLADTISCQHRLLALYILGSGHWLCKSACLLHHHESCMVRTDGRLSWGLVFYFVAPCASRALFSICRSLLGFILFITLLFTPIAIVAAILEGSDGACLCPILSYLMHLRPRFKHVRLHRRYRQTILVIVVAWVFWICVVVRKQIRYF